MDYGNTKPRKVHFYAHEWLPLERVLLKLNKALQKEYPTAKITMSRLLAYLVAFPLDGDAGDIIAHTEQERAKDARKRK
jgi:hypothetical protein